jgi:hypothetical protein
MSQQPIFEIYVEHLRLLMPKGMCNPLRRFLPIGNGEYCLVIHLKKTPLRDGDSSI